MNVTELDLPGVLLIEPDVYGDDRGFFLETYSARRYAAAGITADFVQDSVSQSRRGVVRGLHFQRPNDQAKLVQTPEGAVFDVVVDIRVGSPHFGRWVSARLTADNKHQLFVPAGFAHGVCTESDVALFSYKTGDYYAPAHEYTIRWNDPDLAIDWPVTAPILVHTEFVKAGVSESRPIAVLLLVICLWIFVLLQFGQTLMPAALQRRTQERL